MDDNTAKAFKDLYEEIDKLLYRPTNVPISENFKSEDSIPTIKVPVLKDEDIDDLIEYSKKFVEKTKNEIGFGKVKQSHEHGVQCVRSGKKSNKKLNTPPKWINDGKSKETAGTNCATAIRIIRRIPKTQIKEQSPASDKSPEKYQLNNQRPPSASKKVRNVGVNVNFINKNVTKQSNNIAVATESPASRIPPIIKKPTTPRSSGKIYRFYCSKLSPSQLWEQQHPELSFETSERSIFPKRMKKGDLTAKKKEELVVNQPVESKELKIVHLTEGLANCAINEEKGMAKIEEDNKKVQGENPPQVTPTITKHVIPVISIKGDWKACLQVQETCRINILDEKRNDEKQFQPRNLMYVEVKHGGMSSADPQPYSEAPQTEVTPLKTISEAKEAIIKHDPAIQAINCSNVNRYLQPFLNARKPCVPSNQQMFVDLSHSSSEDSIKGVILESDSSESDTVDNLQHLINFQPTTKAARETKTVPKLNQEECRKELTIVPNEIVSNTSVQLQVPSHPVRLRSPPKTPTKTSTGDDFIEINHDTPSSSKFLENLRIWKSAIEVQSKNMKLGNQLTENLDVLKQNMEVIAGETQNISQIARSCEQNLKHIEQLKERYTKNLDGCGSPTASFHHANQSTPVSNAGCSCFGCHPQLDTFAPEPNFDEKAFQRAVLEQNPRYSRTIQKICEDGRNRSFKKSLTPSRGVAERAAQKFLESCSRSVSRISNRDRFALDESNMSPHSPGSVGSWNDSCCSEVNSRSEGDASLSSSWMVGVTRRGVDECSDSLSVGRHQVTNCMDTGIFSNTSLSDRSSDGFSRVRKSISDEGEVLSQGEIR